jgi:hypothetical protein
MAIERQKSAIFDESGPQQTLARAEWHHNSSAASKYQAGRNAL